MRKPGAELTLYYVDPLAWTEAEAQPELVDKACPHRQLLALTARSLTQCPLAAVLGPRVHVLGRPA